MITRSDFLGLLPEKIRKKIKQDVIIAPYTSFKIGGACDLLIEISSQAEFLELIKIANQVGYPYICLGKGTNILVADEGIEGLVIIFGANYSKIEICKLEEAEAFWQKADKQVLLSAIESLPISPLVTKNITDYYVIRAEAGALLADVSALASSHELTGLEFACGIPGSVGGAGYMNAGAYGNSIQDVCVLSVCSDKHGRLRIIVGDEHNFAYRKSIFSQEDLLVLELYLIAGKITDNNEINKLVCEYTEKRQNSQPLELPSAGSMFKRPKGYFAGKLIADNGLKGLRVGDAMVSPKHAGFVVNVNKAKALDVKRLVELIQKKVKEAEGVDLETEVRFIGRW